MYWVGTKGLLSWTFAILLFSDSAYALSLTDSFTSRSNFGSSTLVWNQALGELHPTVFIKNWSDGVVKNTDFSVGDGRHGTFISSTDYARFSTGGNIAGQIIRINTDTYSDLQFTQFNLLAGWTILPSGSNPLIIRSQMGMTIDGDINCSGDDGVNGTSVNSASLDGGTGRCGGGSGGANVAPSLPHANINNGVAGGPSVTGGIGGDEGDSTGGIGGGGGGGYQNSTGDAGEDPNLGGANDGGALGTRFLDDGFDDDVNGAGSGGGGGSAFDDVGDPTNHSSGGSGGAGGGSIQLYARQDINIGATSVISADGGDGGSLAGTLRAGAGGGGAGGSILMFTAGDINVGGTVSAIGGAGGTSFSAADGGAGSTGRTWLVGEFGDPAITGSLSPASNLVSRGDSRYRAIAFTAESSAVDMGNTGPKITAVNFTDDLQGGTVVLELAFGDTPTDPNLAVFALPATYLTTEQKRFVKFKFTLTSVSETNPTRALDLSIDFDGRTQSEFDFEGACARINGTGSGPAPWALLLLPLSLVLFIRRFQKTNAF